MDTDQKARKRLWQQRLMLAACLVGTLGGATAWGVPPPLPAELQKKVDRAIDQGVGYLKPGNWAPKDSAHLVGYAAMPALTLLECGVPASDPVIQQAASFVRMTALKNDHTYDIALAILFLDKLGDSKTDRPLIQRLALRLIAGQTPTGGWSYKCPQLPDAVALQLMSILKNLDRPDLFDPQAAPIPGDAMARMAIPKPGMGPAPEFMNPAAANNRPQANTMMKPGYRSSADQASQSSEKQRLIGSPVIPENRFTSEPLTPSSSRNWAWCIKMEPSDRELTVAPKRRPKIPEFMQMFAVLHAPNMLPVLDPIGKDQEPLWGTSDNSNTHFAILALWAARRHQVPTVRTLNLIAKRFYTSQNPDGSWGYQYRFGGGDPERPPMTSIGLLGLALSHGLVQDNRAVAVQGQDPWIVNGLVALSKNIGAPSGRTDNLPMRDLYFLWTVERVGMLYDLPTIGNKEWYRWGAEILVGNQAPTGNWANGIYHGNNPTIDTCLALLFLKRANMTAELAKLLPFKGVDLAKEVTDLLQKSAEPMAMVKPPISAPRRHWSTCRSAIPPAPTEVVETPPSPVTPRPTRAVPQDTVAENPSGNGLLWLLVFLAVALLCIGMALAFYYKSEPEPDDDEEEEIEPRPRTKKKVK